MKTKVLYKTTNWLILLVVFVIGLIIFSFFSFILTSSKIKTLTSFINESGVIRGSIQHFTSLHILGSDETLIIGTINKNFELLRVFGETNSTVFTIEEKALFAELESTWQNYIQTYTNLSNSETLSINNSLWILSNKMVDTVEAKAHESIKQLLFYNFLTLFSIVFILFTVLFILRNKVQLQIENQAAFDPLTQLYNRNYIDQLFKEVQKKAKRETKNIAICMCDIDHFKNVNDTYGHETGDLVLQSIAEELKNNSRDSDVIIRYGGEEFLIISLFDSEEKLLHYAERIRHNIENKHIVERPITISIGIRVLYTKTTLEQAIYDADIALYNAKKTGRNRIVFFTH